MIRLNDSLLLSYTKLKTRKIRLAVTVVISALLFACLVFLAIVSSGAVNSLKDFGQEGYGSRFLVQASPLSYDNTDEAVQLLTAKLKPIYEDTIRQKKALAKSLGLTYDAATDQSLPLTTYKDSVEKTSFYPNYASRIALDSLEEINASIPRTTYKDFRTIAAQAGAIKTFRGSSNNDVARGVQSPYVGMLEHGKENLDELRSPKNNSGKTSVSGAQAITTAGWKTLDDELLKPFVLPGQNLKTGADGSVPVIAPTSAAEEILGLRPLPQTASPAEKIQRLSYMRQKISGKNIQLCYRNNVSSSLLSQAIQQELEIAANKNKAGYTPPALIYQVPDRGCAAIQIKSDTRTAEEKKQAEDQQAFDRRFGQETEQSQGILTLRIVGLNPDTNLGSSNLEATSILTSLFVSSLGTGWNSPSSVANNPLVAVVQTGSTVPSSQRSVYYAEFKSLQAMQHFIDRQTCKNTSTPQAQGTPIVQADNTASSNIKECIAGQHAFNVTSYGNSAGAVEEFRSSIWKVARFVILGVIIIATLIMMGNVGKIIADSRRETAVFRALGAKRSDIAQIYIGYTFFLSILVAALSFVIGSIGAYLVDRFISEDLSATAVITYNAQDIHRQFTLIGFDGRLLAAILGLIILAGLLSTAAPLLTNTRRNPINDMRNDT
ncbi:MAG TPA: ABC transporter permease [Candidatus Saccharimonadales bacterium]|nr:ABC transporter permease [Candidatus Saccharimonadales bacterium]